MIVEYICFMNLDILKQASFVYMGWLNEQRVGIG